VSTDHPNDPSPSQWAALTERERSKLPPGTSERVLARFEAEQREAEEAPAKARRASERVSRALGDHIARDPYLTSIYLAAEEQRRTEREELRQAEIARSRPADSFPVEPEGDR
jgi:hypothetical protein